MNKWFENDVKMYGTQTRGPSSKNRTLFENDVKMYGTQTTPVTFLCICCLRMM